MKRVINGKVYNTATARKLGEAHYGYADDFSHWNERLYRSPKGAYFLHGEGGAASHWAERIDQNSTGGGEGIRLLSEGEAQRWAERYLSPEEYEAIWTPEEG